MKTALIIVGVVLALFLLGVSVNNELVRQQEAVKAAWSQVDIALQRRADLIPNLVETVKGYAAHEKGVMDDVANARAALGGARTPAEKIAANGQLDSAISRLLLVVENYPNLKADENFLRLQDELVGTENRIAVERHKYNETLQHDDRAVPEQPLRGNARFPPQRRLLQDRGGGAAGPQGELQVGGRP